MILLGIDYVESIRVHMFVIGLVIGLVVGLIIGFLAGMMHIFNQF